MRMNPLGRSGLMVSELCLGTMTFGTQTSEQEAHAQIDMALEGGINFVDTAEMYPVNPIKAETMGRTEEIIGAWLCKNADRRGDMILATKHSGEGLQSIRNGAPISSQTIPETIEGSLRRLQTDYIDLYQFHWPNRGSYMFRKNWTFDPLMCRLYDTDLAELSVNEEVGLIAYSPLATGLLSGKYQNGAVPEGSRLSLNSDLSGRMSPNSVLAVDAYLAIARKYQVDPVHMALAWCRTRIFMASAIFGATRLAQLDHALGAVDVDLSDECITELDQVHKAHPMPY